MVLWVVSSTSIVSLFKGQTGKSMFGHSHNLSLASQVLCESLHGVTANTILDVFLLLTEVFGDHFGTDFVLVQLVV